MNLIIFNTQGEILRAVSCPDDDAPLQIGPGELFIEGLADPLVDAVDVASMTLVAGGRAMPASPAPTFSQARRAMYPRVEEQLDMLWHAMDSMQISRAEPFYSSIKAVKDANPKPDEGFVFEVTGI